MGDDGLGDLGLAPLAEPGDDQPRVLLGPSVIVGVVQEPGDRPSRLVGRAGAVSMRRPSHRRFDPARMVSQRRAVRPLVELRHRIFVGDRHERLLISNRRIRTEHPFYRIPDAMRFARTPSFAATGRPPASSTPTGRAPGSDGGNDRVVDAPGRAAGPSVPWNSLIPLDTDIRGLSNSYPGDPGRGRGR